MMETVYRKPLGAAAIGALALLIAALAVLVPFRAFAQEGGGTALDFGAGALEAVDFDENTLGSIGDYSAVNASDAVEYSLTGPDADDFYISNDPGDAGTVYNNRPFDDETPADEELEFTVTATEGSESASINVTVTVDDLNDRPYFGTESSRTHIYTCQFEEQAPAATTCKSLESQPAFDGDADRLTYSLSTANTMARYLDISPRLGVVSVSEEGAGKLDAEGGASEFKVAIGVSDGKDIDGNSDSVIDDWAVVRVIVTAVEDEAPYLSKNRNERYATLQVVWTTPRAKAQDYEVQYRAVGDPGWEDHTVVLKQEGIGNRYYTVISGLYADTEYEMRYRIGGGEWTEGNSYRTEAEPNAPAVINGPSSLSSLTVAENAPLDTIISWVHGNSGRGDTPGQNELRYWLTGEGNENFSVERIPDPGGPAFMEALLRPAKALDYEAVSSDPFYNLTVHVSDGRDANGAFDDSEDHSMPITIEVIDVVERAEAPALRTTVLGQTSVRVEWPTPAPSDDADTTGYRVLYNKAGSSKGYYTPLVTGNSVTIEGLTPGTTYELRGLTVADPRILETWSTRDTVVTVTTDSPPTPTPAPTPEPTPAPTPEPTPAPTPDPTPEPTPDPTPEPTPDPTPEPTPDPTPEPTPDPTPAPRPTQPQNLTFTPGSNWVTARWEAPRLGADHRYRVEYRPAGGDGVWITEVTAQSETSTTIRDLSPGRYLLRVRSGEGKWARDRFEIGG